MEPLAYLHLTQDYQEAEHGDLSVPGKKVLASLAKLKPSRLSIALLGIVSGSLGFAHAASASEYHKDYAGGGFFYIFDGGDAAKQVVFVPVGPEPIHPLAVAKSIQPTAYHVIQPSSPLHSCTVLRPGDSGPDVKCLQDQLRELGYFHHSSTGYYGHITKSAVIAFQRDNGLRVDGVAGPQTLSLLSQQTGGGFTPY
ncbi:hypothetical protein C7B76_28860 [filamentous cyanobacterium CCP2]|nr:hypothetical protein C7B76_28860 [filamentous cyanobacterium CCP2]